MADPIRPRLLHGARVFFSASNIDFEIDGDPDGNPIELHEPRGSVAPHRK